MHSVDLLSLFQPALDVAPPIPDCAVARSPHRNRSYPLVVQPSPNACAVSIHELGDTLQGDDAKAAVTTWNVFRFLAHPWFLRCRDPSSSRSGRIPRPPAICQRRGGLVTPAPASQRPCWRRLTLHPTCGLASLLARSSGSRAESLVEPVPPIGAAWHSLVTLVTSLAVAPGGWTGEGRNSCLRLALRCIAWHLLTRPTTSSLGMWSNRVVSDSFAGTYIAADPSLVFCLALLRQHPELVRLVCGWEALPAAIRAGVLATVRAALDEKP